MVHGENAGLYHCCRVPTKRKAQLREGAQEGHYFLQEEVIPNNALLTYNLPADGQVDGESQLGLSEPDGSGLESLGR